MSPIRVSFIPGGNRSGKRIRGHVRTFLATTRGVIAVVQFDHRRLEQVPLARLYVLRGR